jgi:DNA-binding CsgD family transcriptional regulator
VSAGTESTVVNIDVTATGSCLGREHELTQIDQLLTRARAGSGAVALIEGPPGIGKTTLIAEAVSRAAQLEFTVLRASGGLLEREYAFGVVRDLFAPVVEARQTSADGLDGAARLAAEPLGLADGSGERRAAWGDPAAAAMYGLYWLTAKLADDGPLLMTVDDAHWADAMSLCFVLYLSRRLEGLPVLVLLAARADVEHSDTSDLLAELSGHPDLEVLTPSPLTTQDVARMIEFAGIGGPTDAFVTACQGASGGNPFLLHELLIALRTRGVTGSIADAELASAVAPDRVARWVSARLLALGKGPEQLALALSVLGAGTGLSEAAALAALEPSAAAIAADALIAANILEGGGRMQFVHPLVEAAVYERLTPPTRADSHARAARLAAEHGAPIARVAAHLLAAGPGTGEWGLDILRRAAREATATGAPGSAVRYLEQALCEAPLASRAELLLELGQAQLHAGSADGIRSMREALELYADSRIRAEICLTTGRALFGMGDYEAAREMFGRGLDEIADVEGDLFLELRSWHVTDSQNVVPLPPRAAARVAGLLSGDAPGRTRVERHLLAQVAYDSARRGDRSCAEVAQLARRALAAGALLKDCSESPGPFAAASFALASAGELGLARRELSGAVGLSQQRGWLFAFGWFSHLRGVTLYASGDVIEAIADLESAAGAYVQGGMRPLPDTGAMLAVSRLERGNTTGAKEALALPPDVEVDGYSSCAFVYALGRVTAALGQPREGLQTLLACERWIEQENAPNPAANVPWRAHAALLAVRVGERDRAHALVAEDLRLATAFGAPGALGIALRASGLVEGGAQGIAQLAEAAAVLEGSGVELERARALVDYGSALRRGGYRRDALDPLRRGLDLASRCGSIVLSSQAREELVAAGARPRRDRSWGADALTASEKRVARMAAAGMTNSEIAQSLFVTAKTVKVHLTSVYQKLGIDSRGQLARALGEIPGDQAAVGSR